jgi:hypothetical protein
VPNPDRTGNALSVRAAGFTARRLGVVPPPFPDGDLDCVHDFRGDVVEGPPSGGAAGRVELAGEDRDRPQPDGSRAVVSDIPVMRMSVQSSRDDVSAE